MNWVYILRCGDGSLYTGWTNDLSRRLAAHQSGKGGKYTHSHLPVALAYQEAVATPEEARKREWAIKQLSRREKLVLIAAGAPWEQGAVLEETVPTAGDTDGGETP